MKNIDRDFLDKELSRRGQVNLDDLNLEKLEIDGLDLDNIDFDNMDFDEMMEIGGMIEKALDTEEFREIEDLIEMPSKETFQEWIELGEQKYRKRVRRKRILSACAAVLIICIGAIAAINCFKPPTVEAGLDDRMMIENNMDRTTTYDTWADLPTDVQDTFIEIKDLPEGYEPSSFELKYGLNGIKLKVTISNDDNEYIIRQIFYDEGVMDSYIVSNENEILYVEGKEVHKEIREDTKSVTYKYTSNGIAINIVTPLGDKTETVNYLIKTVQ